jgi:uncharacterized protein YdaU (DUF1376 family)
VYKKAGYMHYFQFHIGDYKSHTHHLSLLEDLAFRRLLDHYYLHEVPIKQREIARQIGMRDNEQEVLTVLEEFFVSTEKGYINPRADNEIAKYRKFIEDGKRGAAKRWLKGDDSPPNASPIATINHKPITINQEPKIKTQRGSRLPTDWTLPDEWKAWATAERPDLIINTVADSFRDFWISKPGAGGNKLDWQATWRNWVRSQSAPRQNKFDVAHITTPPPPNQDAALRKIEEDRKKAVPPSLETLARLAELRKGVQV